MLGCRGPGSTRFGWARRPYHAHCFVTHVKETHTFALRPFFLFFFPLGETEKTPAVKEVGYGRKKGESSTATSAPKEKEKERGQEEREKRRKGVKRKRKRNRKGGHSEEKEGV